jgi:protein-tyrosine-phosphatase
VRVLFVCEANRSRSPVAAALWDRELARRADASDTGAPEDAASDAAATPATSAGIHALPGERASHQTSWTAARHGLDLTAHRSRPLDDDTVAEADLILTMTRDQADHIGMNHGRVSDRMFLVSELAELLRMEVDSTELPATRAATAAGAAATATPATGTRTTERLAELLRIAHTRRLMRGIQDDDVTEPGDDPEAVEAMIARLSADVATIAEHLTG